MRIVPLLLALLAAVPAFGGVSADDACDRAVSDAQARYAAAGQAFTDEVAQAVADALRACPGAPTLSADPVVDPETWATLDRTPGALCGYSSAQRPPAFPDVPLAGSVMAAFVTSPVSDQGPATVTFDPAADASTYSITGTQGGWGFSARGAGMAPQPGTITFYGVPIPAETTWAAAGCGNGTPTLCWAEGSATASRPGLYAIYLRSNFDRC